MADAEGRIYSRTLLGIEIDQALAVDRDSSFGVPIPAVFSGSASGWLIANHQGSVTAILPTNTSLQLNAGWAVKYSAFGGLIGGGAGTASGIAYGFTGQRWDPHAALYSFRARWYDTQSGRMVSTDPAGLRAGDANLYRYVGNSPVSHTDPSGKFLKKLFGKIAGFFNKVIDKVFGDNLQKFIRPALAVATTVLGAVVLPGFGAKFGAAIGKTIGTGLTKVGLGGLGAKAGTIGQVLGGGLRTTNLAANASTQAGAFVLGGLNTPSAAGFFSSALSAGVIGDDRNALFASRIAGIGLSASIGYEKGATTGFGTKISEGFAGAAFEGGLSAVGLLGGGFSTGAALAGGSGLSYNLGPGLSIGFSATAGLAGIQAREKRIIDQAVKRRQAEAQRQIQEARGANGSAKRAGADAPVANGSGPISEPGVFTPVPGALSIESDGEAVGLYGNVVAANFDSRFDDNGVNQAGAVEDLPGRVYTPGRSFRRGVVSDDGKTFIANDSFPLPGGGESNEIPLKNGHPVLDKWSLGEVEIAITGDSAADIDEATKQYVHKTGSKPPKGTTFHHDGLSTRKAITKDGKTVVLSRMVLVPTEVNEAIHHTGSASHARAEIKDQAIRNRVSLVEHKKQARKVARNFNQGLRSQGAGAVFRGLAVIDIFQEFRSLATQSGIGSPAYSVTGTFDYTFRDGSSTYVVRDGWNFWSGDEIVYVSGPKKGQKVSITPKQTESLRREAEAVWGKLIPGVPFFTEPTFIPGSVRKTLPAVRETPWGFEEYGRVGPNGITLHPEPINYGF